jgi:hypothetical protein
MSLPAPAGKAHHLHEIARLTGAAQAEASKSYAAAAWAICGRAGNGRLRGLCRRPKLAAPGGDRVSVASCLLVILVVHAPPPASPQ